MPELPEVETVRRGLAPVMEGVSIVRVQVNRADLRWPFPNDMSNRLTGKTVLRLRRRSKYILADLNSGETLLIHLGMSGRMQISGDPIGRFAHNHPARAKHDHVIFDLENGARIAFNDPRRFGAMDLFATDSDASYWLLSKLGPEPLGNVFNETYLLEALHGRKSPIKSALLDQRIVAGLGNIYVCEALFRARISPRRLSGSISKQRILALVPAIRNVLTEAIHAGGSTLRDFRRVDGELGYFQHKFDVYGREAQSCPTPDCSGLIRRFIQSGRSTFYCPRCQR